MDKILIYALSECIGGVEEYALNLSRYNKKQCEYRYIILGNHTPYQKELEQLGVKYYFIAKKSDVLNNMKQIISCFKECRKECNILYFNTSALVYPLPYLIAKRYKYKIVLHSHLSGANGIRRYIHLINRVWIAKLSSVKLACSKVAGEWMFGEKYSEEVILIPNAINLEKFKFNSALRNVLRAEMGINDEMVIGHVGRLSEVKNQSFLINIANIAKEQGVNLKLLLVGDGEDELQLKTKVIELGVEDKVIFYGKSNHPEKLMSCMDCFVMPSKYEGFPITLVEAQANGLPCLVSDIITREVNITGKVKFFSLGCTEYEWLDEIKKISNCRYNEIAVMEQLGFNVNELEDRVRTIILKKGGIK